MNKESLKKLLAEDNAKFQEITANLTQKLEKFARANDDKDADDKPSKEDMHMMYKDMGSMVEYCHQRIDRAYGAIDECYQEMGEHKFGHLPVLSPSQLTALLAKCGADGDYEVAKRMIFASKGIIEAEYKKKE